MAKQQIIDRVNALFNNQIIVDGEDVQGFNMNTLALNLGEASKALNQYPENSLEYQGALSDLATIELDIIKAEKALAAVPAWEEPAAAAPNPAPAPLPEAPLDDFELAMLASMQSLALDGKNRQDKYGFGAAAGAMRMVVVRLLHHPRTAPQLLRLRHSAPRLHIHLQPPPPLGTPPLRPPLQRLQARKHLSLYKTNWMRWSQNI